VQYAGCGRSARDWHSLGADLQDVVVGTCPPTTFCGQESWPGRADSLRAGARASRKRAGRLLASEKVGPDNDPGHFDCWPCVSRPQGPPDQWIVLDHSVVPPLDFRVLSRRGGIVSLRESYPPFLAVSSYQSPMRRESVPARFPHLRQIRQNPARRRQRPQDRRSLAGGWRRGYDREA